MSRIAIALLRYVSRDMAALNRLEVRTNIKADPKNERVVETINRGLPLEKCHFIRGEMRVYRQVVN